MLQSKIHTDPHPSKNPYLTQVIRPPSATAAQRDPAAGAGQLSSSDPTQDSFLQGALAWDSLVDDGDPQVSLLLLLSNVLPPFRFLHVQAPPLTAPPQPSAQNLPCAHQT